MWVPQSARSLLGLSQTGDLGPFTIYTSQRRKPVWFLKAPPLEPPSTGQRRQRYRFKLAMQAWNDNHPVIKAAWNAASKKLQLYVSGPALWLFWQLKRDVTIIRTIEQQSGIQLLGIEVPPP